MMKTILSAVLVTLAVPLLAQSFKVDLASDEWPPFTNVNGQTAVANALVKEALKRGKIGAQTDIVSFAEVLDGIKDGTYHGSAALWKDEEREDYLIFSDPYLQNRLILLGAKGSNVSADSFDDLKGKKVGLVELYAYGQEVGEGHGVEFVYGESNQKNLERLLKGELDYMLADDLLVHYLLKNQPDQVDQHLEVGQYPLVKRDLHFALRKDWDKSEYIIKRFNREIARMREDGSFNRILQLNWVRTDIDGDGSLEMVYGGRRAGELPPSSAYGIPGEGPVTDSTSSYVIKGKEYESWDDVPRRYKKPPKTKSEVEKPGATLRFNF